jgi:hypothetical protein
MTRLSGLAAPARASGRARSEGGQSRHARQDPMHLYRGLESHRHPGRAPGCAVASRQVPPNRARRCPLLEQPGAECRGSVPAAAAMCGRAGKTPCTMSSAAGMAGLSNLTVPAGAAECGLRRGKQERILTQMQADTRGCTRMGLNPARSFTAETAWLNLMSRADAVSRVPSAFISVHLPASALEFFLACSLRHAPEPGPGDGQSPHARQDPMHLYRGIEYRGIESHRHPSAAPGCAATVQQAPSNRACRDASRKKPRSKRCGGSAPAAALRTHGGKTPCTLSHAEP